jgi:hypothetical protein
MILRTKLAAGEAMDVNREFQTYISHFGDAQKAAREILEKLAAREPKLT